MRGPTLLGLTNTEYWVQYELEGVLRAASSSA